MEKIIELIEKWNIKIGYTLRGEILIIDPEIDSKDLKFVKKYRPDIMAYLEKKKEEEELEIREKYRREYFEEEHSEELEESRRTGEWVVYAKGMEPCDTPGIECAWDYVTRYLKVTSDKIETKQERQHTYKERKTYEI